MGPPGVGGYRLALEGGSTGFGVAPSPNPLNAGESSGLCKVKFIINKHK